jgi:hypothetical protein
VIRTRGNGASSGDDIGRDLVFDEGDAVAQLKLAFLQPLQPQQIGRGGLMQGIDRRVEIAMFLLQPGELGPEFALIFVGHGVSCLKRDEFAKRAKMVEPASVVETISLLPAGGASNSVPPVTVLIVPSVRSRFISHENENENTLFNFHRQPPVVMYTRLSRSKLSLIVARRLGMAIQAHLVELERKHKVLESELHDALVHLSTDDLRIVELKRRKLMVKDEIERLRETLH